MAKAESQKSLDSWTKEDWGNLNLVKIALKVKMRLVSVTCLKKQEKLCMRHKRSTQNVLLLGKVNSSANNPKTLLKKLLVIESNV